MLGKLHKRREKNMRPLMKFLLALMLFFTANAFAEIQINFDRFSKKTIVTTEGTSQFLDRMEVELTPRWFAKFDGQKPTLAPPVSLTFWKKSESWEYLRCNVLAMLVDGSPFPVGTSKHDGTVGSGYVLERISVSLTAANATKLSKANLVEFKICNTEGRFSENDLADLRKIIQTIKP